MPNQPDLALVDEPINPKLKPMQIDRLPLNDEWFLEGLHSKRAEYEPQKKTQNRRHGINSQLIVAATQRLEPPAG